MAVATGPFAVRELSGVAWTGGSGFVAVGDNGVNDLWRLDVAVHPATGQLGAATVTGSLAVPGLAVDGEGVVYLPSRGSVLVSDEASSSIREFRLSDGGALGSLAVPQVYRAPNLRSNLGLEALGARDGAVWTANETPASAASPVRTTNVDSTRAIASRIPVSSSTTSTFNDSIGVSNGPRFAPVERG